MENTKVQEYAEDLFRRYPELLPASESIFQAYSIIENSFFKSKILFLCEFCEFLIDLYPKKI